MRVPDPVYKRAIELKEEGDYASLGEAVRNVFLEAGYDV